MDNGAGLSIPVEHLGESPEPTSPGYAGFTVASVSASTSHSSSPYVMTQIDGSNCVETQAAIGQESSAWPLQAIPPMDNEEDNLTSSTVGESLEPLDSTKDVSRGIKITNWGPYRSQSQTSNIRKLRNCAEEMWKEQEGRFKKWKDEINCLLLFAGLLTTILTGFIVTYYVVRQSQTSTSGTDVLWFMSLALTLAAASMVRQ